MYNLITADKNLEISKILLVVMKPNTATTKGIH